MKKLLPTGLSDYKILIEENYYYIDKTLLIDDILRYGSRVILLPRPRRFGKTLNMSMLKYFFEKTAVSNAYLFEDKKIWQLPERVALQGKFPVIFLTFKDIKEPTWHMAKSKLISVIADEYRRHKYLLTSDVLDQEEKALFNNIYGRVASDDDYQNSLKNLSEYLYRFHGMRTFVLIDEYDSPIHAGFTHDYYADIITFMRGLLTSAFKDNQYLERGVLTGILRTAKEGIFSGLNNLEVFTVLDNFITDKFGFTQQEIDQLLKDYDFSVINQEFKEWYNGYLIGDIKIYNPWSALNCVKRVGEFIPYWVNTSDNALIYEIVAQSGPEFKQACADLIAGKVVENVAIMTDVTLKNIVNQPNAIWSLLLFSGYVTPDSPNRIVKGIRYADLRLPNEELHVLFRQLVNDLFVESLNFENVSVLYEVLQKAEGEVFEELLEKFVTQSMSYHDISEDEPEKSYHLFVLGLLIMLAEKYQVLSNRESGRGRFDIMLIAKDATLPSFVIEFKKMSKNETMSECADRALEQIKDRKYAAQLEQQGVKRVVAFGIAVHKKAVLLKQEEL